MARTHGHGNPNWTRDETILALDLYFACDGVVPSRENVLVQELSALLRQLPYHDVSSQKGSFRNPDGVTFKLQNLRQVGTGKGLANVSAMDRKVWNEFSADRGKLRHLARLIRLGVKLTETKGGTEDDVEFVEGRVLTELHKRRERNPRIRKLLIESRRKRGRLTCEMCLAPPDIDDPRFEDAIFEAHHIVPIAEAKERTTRLVDLSLLCANCHRLIHRAIAHHKMWLSIEECRTALGLASPSLE